MVVGGVMKRLLIALLALVAVFCTFTGCSDGDKANIDEINGNGTDITETTENGENSGDDLSEDDKETQEENGETEEPSYKIVAPITDGGGFVGGNYN